MPQLIIGIIVVLIAIYIIIFLFSALFYSIPFFLYTSISIFAASLFNVAIATIVYRYLVSKQNENTKFRISLDRKFVVDTLPTATSKIVDKIDKYLIWSVFLCIFLGGLGVIYYNFDQTIASSSARLAGEDDILFTAEIGGSVVGLFLGPAVASGIAAVLWKSYNSKLIDHIEDAAPLPEYASESRLNAFNSDILRTSQDIEALLEALAGRSLDISWPQTSKTWSVETNAALPSSLTNAARSLIGELKNQKKVYAQAFDDVTVLHELMAEADSALNDEPSLSLRRRLDDMLAGIDDGMFGDLLEAGDMGAFNDVIREMRDECISIIKQCGATPSAASSDDQAKADALAVFNLPPDASFADAKKAYRSMIKSFHPDSRPESKKHDPAADAEFIRLTDAYNVLKDAFAK